MNSSTSMLREYENQFAKVFAYNAKAFTFWKGRVALHAILEAFDIGSGDEVIIPGFTCIVVPNAIIYRGALPVYADINSDTFNIDPGSIEHLITSRTKAIVVQHTFGIPANMDTIMTLAHQAGVVVIEDCAHALGSRYKGRLLGTMGDASFFSFQWSKPYSTGLGGMALTTDSALADRLAQIQLRYSQADRKEIITLRLQGILYRHLYTPRLHWLAQDVLHLLSDIGLFIGSSSTEELECRKPKEYEKRMAAFQATWGLRELTNLEKNLNHRRQITQLYEHLLLKAGFRVVEIPSYADPVFLRYPLLVKDKQAVIHQARKARVEIGNWFESVLHPAGSPLESAGYRPGQCPVGEEITRYIINLPTHAKVTEKEVIRVVEFLNKMRNKGYA